MRDYRYRFRNHGRRSAVQNGFQTNMVYGNRLAGAIGNKGCDHLATLGRAIFLRLALSHAATLGSVFVGLLRLTIDMADADPIRRLALSFSLHGAPGAHGFLDRACFGASQPALGIAEQRCCQQKQN